MAVPEYNVLQGNRNSKGIKYFFVSKGKKDVVKAVDYSYVQDYSGRKLYNLGFGDFNLDTNEINDGILTDNGDKYAVFQTVLSTIPLFFEAFSQSIMIVRGSDSSVKFQDECKLSCNRNCNESCRKANRRIQLYCSYVDKNYEELSKDYDFYGGMINDIGKFDVEDYIKEKKYKAVLVIKK